MIVMIPSLMMLHPRWFGLFVACLMIAKVILMLKMIPMVAVEMMMWMVRARVAHPLPVPPPRLRLMGQGATLCEYYSLILLQHAFSLLSTI